MSLSPLFRWIATPMPRNLPALLLLLLIVACPLLFVLTYGDGVTEFTGSVVDSAGQPIPGVEILIRVVGESRSHGPHTVITDEVGRYQTLMTHRPGRVELELTCSHAGYEPYAATIRSPHERGRRGDGNRVIVLKKSL